MNKIEVFKNLSVLWSKDWVSIQRSLEPFLKGLSMSSSSTFFSAAF